MIKFTHLVLLGACLYTTTVFASEAASPPHAKAAPTATALLSAKDCGDFLARAGKKPQHLAFVGCTLVPDRQGKPLEATYSVRGRHAAAVEAFLVKNAGLIKLKRACCQWDAPAGQFNDKAGRSYQITMVSPETTVSARKNWRLIPRFQIIVESMTEEI